MPFMKHVYKILHIRSVIPGEGLEFKNITRREVEQDYVRKLEIKGFVVNASEIQREIPMILVKLVDDNANVVQETKVFPPVDFVAPGMSTSFEVLVDSPSSSAKYVVTTFTDVITSYSIHYTKLYDKADIYPRLKPTMEWDTAAGHAILKAAGGMVENLSGEELTYGHKPFLNP